MSDDDFRGFASGAGVAAIERFENAEDSGDLDVAAASVSEALFWWGVVNGSGPAPSTDDEVSEALRFARNCAAHRRVATRTQKGRGWPREWPTRYGKRLKWASTDFVEVGARDLHKSTVQTQRAAYDSRLSGRDVAPLLVEVRAFLE